jgi:hypothetical protein
MPRNRGAAPALRKAADQFVNFLCAGDREACRAVAAELSREPRSYFMTIVQVVIDRLLDTRQQRRVDRNTEALAALGIAVVPTVCQRLAYAVFHGDRLRLIAVLVALGRTIDPKDRSQVADVLYHQGRNDEMGEVRSAIRHALIELKDFLPAYLKDEPMDFD